MEENRKKINFGAAFSLAALMFSVYVGPGFASGTQTLTYFMTKGWFGIFLGPILCGLLVFVWCFLFFEFNRKYKPRDFRQQNDMLYTNKYVKKALGILVDVSAVVQIFLVVAAMISGASILLKNMIGMPVLVGTIIFAVLITVLSLFGAKLVLRVGNFLTICILGVTGYIAVVGIPKLWAQSQSYLAQRVPPTEYGFSWPSAIYIMFTIMGAMLAAKNAAVPVSAETMKNKKDSLVASLSTGVLCACGTMVYTVIFAAGMPAILKENIPTLYALQDMIKAGSVSVILYDVIALAAMLSTGVGLMYGGLTRYTPLLKGKLKNTSDFAIKLLVCAFFIIGSTLLSKFGILKIIGVGYTAMGIIVTPLTLWIFFIMIPYRMKKDNKLKD